MERKRKGFSLNHHQESWYTFYRRISLEERGCLIKERRCFVSRTFSFARRSLAEREDDGLRRAVVFRQYPGMIDRPVAGTAGGLAQIKYRLTWAAALRNPRKRVRTLFSINRTKVFARIRDRWDAIDERRVNVHRQSSISFFDTA